MPDIQIVRKTERGRRKNKNKSTTALSFLVTFALVEFHQVSARNQSFWKEFKRPVGLSP